MQVPSAVCTSSVRIFLLSFFRQGAFLTSPRAKSDDTAVERRSIPASRNALAINVILKAAMASPPQIASAHLRSHRRRSGIDLRNRFTALTRFFRSEQTGGGHARRYSHPRFPNAERSTPGGAYHSPGAIAGAELQSDAIRNPQRRTCNRIWLRIYNDTRLSITLLIPGTKV